MQTTTTAQPHVVSTRPARPSSLIRLGRTAAAAGMACAVLLTACDRKTPAQPPLPSATANTGSPGSTTGSTTGSGTGITGVVPQSDSSVPASDRPGAPTMGAVEAGQARGTGSGGAPVPTAGDGASPASAAVPAASR